MRVITGTAKGKNLLVPSKGTRPLTDRIKTSLFDLISDFIPGASVLDLYAGSGSFGIEALSRGAEKATFIDLSKESVELINENLFTTELVEKGVVVNTKVNDFVAATDEQFDIIFLDPPFDAGNDEDFSGLHKILKDDGVLIYRLPKYKNPKILKTEPFIEVYNKKYGKSYITFLKKS